MRCGTSDPLCAAEQRSLSRIRARDCLSGAKRSEFERDPAKGEQRKAARRAGAVGSTGPYCMPGALPRDKADPPRLVHPSIASRMNRVMLRTATESGRPAKRSARIGFGM